MGDELLYRRQVSRQHLEVLAEYMERYPPLALASARSREGMIQSKRMWEKIARALNKIDDNISKSGKNWARYWIDLKFKIRRKYACMRKCQSEGVQCSVQLNPFEERIIKVLTDEEGNLVSPNATYQPKNPVSSVKASEDSSQDLKDDSKMDDSEDQDFPEEYQEDYILPTSEQCPTEVVNVPETDIKPNISTQNGMLDPIQISDRKSTEELRRELIEFELRRQRELFEMEKRQRREKHELEVSILRLRKQVLLKELKKT